MSPPRSKLAFTQILLLLPAIAACAGAPKQERVAPAPRAPLAGSDVLIIFEESSADNPAERVLTVGKDGRLEFQVGSLPPRRSHAPQTEVEELRRLVSDAGFRLLEARYTTPLDPGDRDPATVTTYRISVSTEGESRTVVTEEGAQQPAVLRRTISDLKRLMTLVERQGTEYGI